MAAADAQQAAADTYGRTRGEFDDPVIVRSSVTSKGRTHEPDADRPRPVCHHGSRGDAEWQFMERSDTVHIDDCSVCRGDVGPNDHSSSFKDCPFCDDDVKTVNWPDHIRQCAP